MREGYGPNGPALLGLVAKGAALIVCVDCGTAAAEALAMLAGQADAIVLDHHKSEGPPPRILATVNPNRLDCSSGLTMLCAAGVAFLTVVAATRTLRRRGFFAARSEPDLMALLDLVALATVCDVMPLSGVNRALVYQGLRIMARRARPGVAALLEVTQAREKLSAFTCGYALGPRINASGRIAEADLGLRLLLCEDRIEALALAERLDGINRQRQDVEAGILEAAMYAASVQAEAGSAVLVVAGEGWHPGVVGIVSRRVKERFNCWPGQCRRDRLRRSQGFRPFGSGPRSGRGGDCGAAGWHPVDRGRAPDGGWVFAAGRPDCSVSRLSERAAGGGGGVTGRRRFSARRGAAGSRCDSGSRPAHGTVGTVWCGQ